jgi:hypothetical protein
MFRKHTKSIQASNSNTRNLGALERWGIAALYHVSIPDGSVTCYAFQLTIFRTEAIGARLSTGRSKEPPLTRAQLRAPIPANLPGEVPLVNKFAAPVPSTPSVIGKNTDGPSQITIL